MACIGNRFLLNTVEVFTTLATVYLELSVAWLVWCGDSVVMITGGMWRPGARPSWRPGGSARPSTRGCWRSRSGGRRSSGRWPGQVVSRLSSSFCLHLLPQTNYVSLSRLSPADCLILGAFCRLCGHFFDLYCKCFASLFTLTLLPFDIPLNVHHRYRQHVLLHPYLLFQVLTLLSIFSDQFLKQISWP